MASFAFPIQEEGRNLYHPIWCIGNGCSGGYLSTVLNHGDSIVCLFACTGVCCQNVLSCDGTSMVGFSNNFLEGLSSSLQVGLLA